MKNGSLDSRPSSCTAWARTGVARLVHSRAEDRSPANPKLLFIEAGRLFVEFCMMTPNQKPAKKAGHVL